MNTQPWNGLVDSFVGSSINVTRWPEQFGETNAEIVGGRVVATEQLDLTTAEGEAFDDRYAYMRAEVGSGMYGGIYVISDLDWNNYFGVDIYGSGTIEVWDSAEGSALWSDTYDPVAHRFVGIEEEDGALYVRVSPDGVTWTTVWSGDPLGWMSAVRVWVGCSVDSSPSSEFTLYAVNTGVIPPSPPAASLQDCFDGSQLNTEVWADDSSVGTGSITVSGGALRITNTGYSEDGESQRGVQTRTEVDFSGDKIVEFEIAPGGPAKMPDDSNGEDQSVLMFVYLGGIQAIIFSQEGGIAYVDHSFDGRYPLDWGVHRFWRFRRVDADDVYVVESSPDRQSWTERREYANASDALVVGFFLQELWFNDPNPGDPAEFVIAGVNCPPDAPVAAFTTVIQGRRGVLLIDNSKAGSAKITSWTWEFWEQGMESPVLGESEGQNAFFLVPDDGTFVFRLTIEDENGSTSSATRTLTFGPGFTVGPYDLPTTKYAGRLIVELDPLIDWASVGATGVIVASDGSAWLDLFRVPTPTGVENRVVSVNVKDGAEQPVRTLEAIIHLNTDAGSLSPGAVNSPLNLLSGAYSPAIFGKRRIIYQRQVSGAPGSTDPDDYVPKFWGEITRPPVSSDGDLRIFARDLACRLMIPYTGDPIPIGDPGDLIELDDALQAVADAVTSPGEWPLHVPDEDLQWGVPAFTLGRVPNGLEFMRQGAQQRDAVVRWWYDPGTERFQLTLFNLREDKDSPDFTYGPDETLEIAEHSVDTENYRNDFTLFYFPEGSQVPARIVRPATDAEKRSFGRVPVMIGTDATQFITTAEDANRMLDGIEEDLRLPAVIGRRRIPFIEWGIEINSKIRFTADARVSQEAVDFYVTDWELHEGADGDWMEFGLRAAPVGQLGAWLRQIRDGGTEEEEVEQPQLPAVEYEVKTTLTTGTLWWRIQERGIPVQATDSRTKTPDSTWTQFALPDRGPGDESVVRGGTLGPGEYETDVDLTSAGDQISYIHARYRLMDGAIHTIVIQPVDADAHPRIIDIDIQGVIVDVLGDDDVESIEIVKTSGAGSAYDDAVDGNSARFTVPVPQGEVWTLNVTGYNTTIANRGDPGELSHTVAIVVSNEGITVPGESGPQYPDDLPTFDQFVVTKPDVGSNVVTIGIKIANPNAAYRIRVTAGSLSWIWTLYVYPNGSTESQRSNVQFVPQTEINNLLSPPLTTQLPETLTNFSFPTPFRRVADIPTTTYPRPVATFDIVATLETENGAVLHQKHVYIAWNFELSI